jgi:hypothetical protein
MSKRAILCGVLLILSAPLGADNRLAIQVSPAVSFAPANLVVKTMIEADHENRAVEIVAQSESFYRSSEVELDGENAPRTTVFEFRSLPGGTYDVAATLFNSSGKPLRVVHTQVDVISSDGR